MGILEPEEKKRLASLRARGTRTAGVLSVGIVFGLGLLAPPAAVALRGNCSQQSIGLTPLTEMGDDTYMGAEGGLYPGGSNSIPADHQSLGLMLASHVGPLDTEGRPAPDGKIGFMGVGVSTTGDDWEGFASLVAAEPGINPQLVLVNGGVSGHPIDNWLAPSDFPWSYLSDQTSLAGLTAPQIQIAWVMLPDRYPSPPPFPGRQETYRDQLQVVLRLFKSNFPNLLLAYLSSHQYAGYGTGNITEPGNGYEHGFGVKWTIESQILGEGGINADPRRGPMEAPWIAWGPYTWADGLTPRADGLIWECSDFARDGSHPSDAGSAKLGQMLLQFFMSDPTTTPWFLGEGVEPRPPVTTAAPTSTTESTIPSTTTASTTTTAPAPTTTSTAPLAVEPPGDSAGVIPWLIGLGGLVAGAIIWLALAARARSRRSR